MVNLAEDGTWTSSEKHLDTPNEHSEMHNLEAIVVIQWS